MWQLFLLLVVLHHDPPADVFTLNFMSFNKIRNIFTYDGINCVIKGLIRCLKASTNSTQFKDGTAGSSIYPSSSFREVCWSLQSEQMAPMWGPTSGPGGVEWRKETAPSRCLLFVCFIWLWEQAGGVACAGWARCISVERILVSRWPLVPNRTAGLGGHAQFPPGKKKHHYQHRVKVGQWIFWIKYVVKCVCYC